MLKRNLAIAILVLLAGLSAGCDDPFSSGDGHLVAAGFTSETDGLFVKFLNTSQGANAWQWTFGDGSPESNDFEPTHEYNASGSYTVRQVACPDDNLQGDRCDTATGRVTVSSTSSGLRVEGVSLRQMSGGPLLVDP